MPSLAVPRVAYWLSKHGHRKCTSIDQPLLLGSLISPPVVQGEEAASEAASEAAQLWAVLAHNVAHWEVSSRPRAQHCSGKLIFTVRPCGCPKVEAVHRHITGRLNSAVPAHMMLSVTQEAPDSLMTRHGTCREWLQYHRISCAGALTGVMSTRIPWHSCMGC